MEDPFLNLSYDGESVAFNRRTASLFKFLGDWATHDHIFIIEESPEDERRTGFYIFKDNDNYMNLARFMIDHKFQIHLNLPQPSGMDKEAFDISHYGDIEGTDSFPPEWGQDAA